MPRRAELARVLFRGEIILLLLFIISFLIGIKFADAISLNTVDDHTQWVTSNAGVLSVAQDTGTKQEGTGSVKLVATQGEATWYDTAYGNRKPVTITHSGDTLTDADILVTIDTASLISAGKLQSDCDDLRFTDSDGTTDISYWLESGCNTSTTQAWVEVPSIPDGGKTVYFYYNNDSADNGEQIWSGNFTLLNNGSCSGGWSRNLDLDNKFPRGSSSYGATGGNDSHNHSNASCTSGGPSSTHGSLSGTGFWKASISHNHSLTVGVSSSSNLPPYTAAVYCSSNEPTINSGLIAIFDSSAPSGWTRFSALDNRFPRGAESYGATGGSSTHSHSTSGQGTSSHGTQGARGSGDECNAAGNHSHTTSNGSTGSASSLPPYLDVVLASKDESGNAPSGMISIVSSVPPIGWTRFGALDSKFPRGAASYGATGGSSTHSHSVSISTGGASSVQQVQCWGSNSFASNHTHSCSTSTDSQSTEPAYIDVIFAKRNSSAASTEVGSEQQNGANNHTVTDTIDAANFSGYEDVSFYVRSNRTGTFTRFEMGESSSSEQTYAINISAADTWELKTWDISGLTGTDIDAITKMAFRVTDASTGFDFWFDNVRANSAPSTPTVSTPADDTWTNSREFCATTTDADSDNWNATFVLDGIGSYDGEVVASGEESCYTHTDDLSSVSWYANASDTNSYVSGNTSSYTAKIDSVAPSNLSASNSSDSWVTDQPTITVSTPTDATSGINEIRYVWDTNTLGASCDGGTTTSAGADLTGTLTQGSHILYLCVTDVAGGVTTWNGAYKWDNGNPLVNITSHISTTYNASNIPSAISGTASDVASAVAGVTVAVTDGVNYWTGTAWNSLTRVWLNATGTTSWSLNFTPDKDGSFTVESQSTDSAGNTSSIDSVTFSYDSIAPGISVTPSVSVTDTTATVNWETDDNASTRIQYGASSSYSRLTTITNLSPRVTAHSRTITDLRSCITYHYRVLGTDAAGNQLTGTDRTFTTTGCVGSATIEEETKSTVTNDSGGTFALQESGSDRVALTVPPSFTNQSATFQVKKLAKTEVLAATSVPQTALNAVGSHVYQMDALTEELDLVSSFNEAINVTITYTDDEVTGLDESSLVIYRWDGSSWNELSDCTVDTDANTVTCSTTAFSTFILFGSEQPSSGGGSSGSSGGGNVCGGPPPGLKAPWIYGATPVSSTAIKLYFADGDNPIEKYVLNYGTQSEVYIYGSENIGGRGNGWREYVVEGLQPGTEYFFRVRGEHKCQPGGWSNEFNIATPTSVGGSETLSDQELAQRSLVDSIELNLFDEGGVCETYTVQSGQGLWEVTEAMLGDPYRYREIVEANISRYPSLETSPSYLEIGWELVSPDCRGGSGEPGITVRLIDNRERPIGNVKVTLNDQEAWLDETGTYTFPLTDGGDYTIAVYNDEGVVIERRLQIDQVGSYEMVMRVKNRVPWDGLPWYQAFFGLVFDGWRNALSQLRGVFSK